MPTKGSVIMVDIEIRLDNKDTENKNRVFKYIKVNRRENSLLESHETL